MSSAAKAMVTDWLSPGWSSSVLSKPASTTWAFSIPPTV